MNLKYSFLLTLLILPCFIASDENYPQEFEEKADSLIDLTETNFDQNVLSGDNDRWFVMFYARWCPHCQDATSLFNELSKALDGKVKVGRVDCDANPGLRDRYSIQGIPTFLYFYKDEIHQYEGDRTVEAWTQFANEGFKKTENKEPGDIKTVEDETHLLVDRNQENSEDIIRNPGLIELTDKNFDSQVKNGERWFDRWFVMFYVPWCPHSQNAMSAFDELANSLQNQLNFGKVDCDTEDDLREKYSIQAYPTFLYFYKGEIRQYEGDRTVEAWTEFVNSGYKTVGTTEPQEAKAVEENSTPVNSEEIFSQETYLSENLLLENPENITQQPPVQESSLPVNVQWKDDSLIELSDINFNYKVLTGMGKWFIMFYNPWCPVCRETMPTFIQLAKSLQGEVTVGRIDVDASPYTRTRYAIQEHPTFLYFEKKEPSKYEGENTVEAWTEFVKNGGEKKIIEESRTPFAPEEQQPENQYNMTQQPESIDYLIQQPLVEAVPQLPENVTQLPDEERPQFERAENISQLPENAKNITQQFPAQGIHQPENSENVTQKLPVQERPQIERAENITQQLPDQVRPLPESSENVTQQLRIEERPQVERAENISQLPENAENITQQVPVQERPRPETAENITQLPENTENITQQFPDQGRPQPETPVNIPQLPENTENITQQLPNEGIPQPQSPENITQQVPVQERPQIERAENITQQLPDQVRPEPESPENITQPIPDQENLQPKTLEGALIDLTEANFDNNVHSDENRKWFVMFYTPWCPHCNEAMPTFGELVNSLRDQVSVGKVDCDANPGLRDRFSIQAYPIFLYFYKGEIHQYKGPREIEAWTEFATTHYRYTDIQAPDDDKIIERDTTPLNRNESIAAPPQIPEITEEQTDSLIDLCDDDFDSKVFANVEEKWFVMFYDPSCPRCQEAMPTFGELANSLNGQVSVARVDCDANPGLAAKYNIQDHPTFLLFYQGETHQYDGLRTIEAWTDFATTDYKSAEVPLPETETVIERDSAPFYLNESVVPPQTPAITEEKTDSLIDLCDDDFESNVFSQDKEKWFVMFYAPWCPHCGAAMPEFGEFANSLKDRVSVARVDCEANPGLRDKYSIQGYPTFLFFYKGEIHQYEGPRTVEAWTEFVTRDYKSTETQTQEEVKEIEKDSSPIPSEPQHIPQERTPTITAEETDSLIDLNKDNFNTKVFANEDDKWMIMFYAPWCPHCKHAMPAFKELAKVVKGHAKVGRVDCDANPELRTRFAIEGYPTFLFFSDGDVRKFEGARTIEAWSNFVDEGYKKVKAIEENVHEIKEVVHHATKFFELTPAVMIIGGALIGAVLLFCFLAITHRKNEDTTIRHAQLENTDASDDSRIYMD